MIGRETAIWLMSCGWLVAVTAGFWVWERYEGTPGASSTASAVAAEQTTRGRWTLTVFAHPRCPCTRATLLALSELAHSKPDLSVRVLFVSPPNAPAGWESSDSWTSATAIPGADVGCDTNSVEARRCGARTSGQAVLADPEGRIVFRGGLTRARGREGPSAGRQAVLDWLAGRTAVGTAPVFGCGLFDSDE